VKKQCIGRLLIVTAFEQKEPCITARLVCIESFWFQKQNPARRYSVPVRNERFSIRVEEIGVPSGENRSEFFTHRRNIVAVSGIYRIGKAEKIALLRRAGKNGANGD